MTDESGYFFEPANPHTVYCSPVLMADRICSGGYQRILEHPAATGNRAGQGFFRPEVFLKNRTDVPVAQSEKENTDVQTQESCAAIQGQDGFGRPFRGRTHLRAPCCIRRPPEAHSQRNTIGTNFCFAVPEEALAKYVSPDIFNTDQGSPVWYLNACETGSEPVRDPQMDRLLWPGPAAQQPGWSASRRIAVIQKFKKRLSRAAV